MTNNQLITLLFIITTLFGVHFLVALIQAPIVLILPLIAIMSSILAVVVIITASYLVITRPVSFISRVSTMKNAISDTLKERWQSFSLSDLNEFLKEFLLSDEIAVLKAMAVFLISDGIDFSKDQDTREKMGWRNKHCIVKESKVSQKRVYSKGGIIDRMESLGMVEKKASDSSWGGMKYLYRLRIESDFVKAYTTALKRN